MLMNLTQGWISPTCLRSLFTGEDSKSAKKTVKPSVSFCSFGMAHPKAAHKMLVKFSSNELIFSKA